MTERAGRPFAATSHLRPYWIAAAIVLVLWTGAMSRLGWWGILTETWPLSLTMVLGSFVAGATAEGGGAVAFPVFTKAFGIPPHDAKVFAFMIQSFGMTMAGLVIFLRKIPVLWNVIGIALAGGVVGLVGGELLLDLPDPLPKLFFSLVAGIFGFFLVWNRWVLNHRPSETLRLRGQPQVGIVLLTGIVGGAVSSVIGVGIDMTLFIVLTLLFGVNEKISTPTTVVLMGLLSVVGFFWHGVAAAGIHEAVWQYWMSCLPVVIFGAPAGAWVCSRISRDQLLYFLLFLISLDLVSTLVLIPLDAAALRFLSLSAGLAVALFSALILLRRAAT